jgi:hypothetical protein
MFARFMTLQGEVEAFYDEHDVSTACIYWRRRWWQLRRRPVEDARLVLWCIEYLRVTKERRVRP